MEGHGRVFYNSNSKIILTAALDPWVPLLCSQADNCQDQPWRVPCPDYIGIHQPPVLDVHTLSRTAIDFGCFSKSFDSHHI